MRIKTVLKLIVAVVLLAGVVGAGSYFLWSSRPKSDNAFGWKFPVAKFPSTGSTPTQIAYSDIRDPGGIPQGLPVRLKIPIIGVDSAIEDALITPDGRMDVPVGSVDVAWFALGPHPGQVGSAVIGGHFGIANGVPYVFYNLDKLKIGDKVYVVDDKDNTLAFVVRSISSFDRNADATTVFTSNDGLAHLNLITCEGIWNQVNGTYPLRLVVFTDAIPSESAVEATTTFPRSLGIGSQGADVATLQTALEQKGFLAIPAGVTKGVFGALTSAAIAKYQTSVGLPSVGVFGPLTRARLISELKSATALPNTGISATANNPSTIGSLYATPLDGLITSLLLIAIIFMTLKIIGRFVLVKAR